MDKQTVRDVDLKGKRVVMRADFNVPLKEGIITDDTRIQAALPTISYILEQGASLILMSHLGRPKGKTPELSLKPVAAYLSTLLGKEIKMAPDVVGDDVQAMAKTLKPGDVMVLENTRFYAEETKNNLALPSSWRNWVTFLLMTPLERHIAPMPVRKASPITCLRWRVFSSVKNWTSWAEQPGTRNGLML